MPLNYVTDKHFLFIVNQTRDFYSKTQNDAVRILVFGVSKLNLQEHSIAFN
jgi:hypothetical protein